MSSIKSVTSLLSALVLSVVAQQASATEASEAVNATDPKINIEWVEPKKFRDVRSATGGNAKYREHVFKHLEEHLASLAKSLPQGQSLKMSVTDLDLAGRIEPSGMLGLGNMHSDVRVIRDIDIPRMQFSYQLVNDDGSVIKSEDVKLKDMSFRHGLSRMHQDKPFIYEKRMLTKWFESNLVEQDS